jgi:succinylglutamate desuccinylase
MPTLQDRRATNQDVPATDTAIAIGILTVVAGQLTAGEMSGYLTAKINRCFAGNTQLLNENEYAVGPAIEKLCERLASVRPPARTWKYAS